MPTAPSDAPTRERDVLTRDEAATRAARVGPVAYEINLELTADATIYRGDVRMSFPVRGIGDLFLDFRGGTIELLEINGSRVGLPDRPGARILLPGPLLEPETSVRVVYENEYDRNGDGFHRFVDPVDGEVYIYSNFEPFEAHRLFPCFDQPDLKGTLAIQVTAPAAWNVISNSPADATLVAPGGRRTHRFATTPPISTYLAAVIAGPYVGVHAEHRGLPLGVWSRRSIAAFVDAEEIFAITGQGMDFYADLFSRPYPFAKYDQIFVPEFNAGAMENVGAVTFTEQHVYRDPPTETQRLGRAETILHELAHMWFGDLVTMRWWDDIWLNESFATYVSNLALAEATRFEGAWRAFHADMKRWGYQADDRSTTHPISGIVPDTDATFYNFDGITYGKGAAVLKQLVAWVGRDAFVAGLRVYFDRHAWGNASLADFLVALEEGSGRQLGDWARRWLETASLNTLAARWTAQDGRVDRLELAQDAPAAHPTLRPHALEIALVRAAHDGGAVVDVVSAQIDGAETWVAAAAGRPAPALVFPNHGDHAYAKVVLDPTSRAALPDLLPRIEDPLLRQLMWGTLWEMVRDGQHPSTDFLDLVREVLPREADDQIVEAALDAARGAIAHYVPEARRVPAARAFVHTALEVQDRLPAGDLRRLWLRAAIGALADPDDATRLTGLLDGTLAVPEVVVDQEMRWGIVTAASAFGLAGAAERTVDERQRDRTDRGERFALTASVSAPDAALKAEAWVRIHADGYGSLHRTRAAMAGFNHAHQAALLAPYVEAFFAAAPGVVASHEHAFSNAYVARLFPGYRVEEEIALRARALADAERDRLPTLRRLLLEAADDLERALRCRAVAEA
jgi:aminopeptidase N